MLALLVTHRGVFFVHNLVTAIQVGVRIRSGIPSNWRARVGVQSRLQRAKLCAFCAPVRCVVCCPEVFASLELSCVVQSWATGSLLLFLFLSDPAKLAAVVACAASTEWHRFRHGARLVPAQEKGPQTRRHVLDKKTQGDLYHSCCVTCGKCVALVICGVPPDSTKVRMWGTLQAYFGRTKWRRVQHV